jgi:putative ABC transport system substrate-binding protein
MTLDRGAIRHFVPRWPIFNMLGFSYCARRAFMDYDMRRREFITALGGMVVAWPVVTRAQQPVRKIGFLSVSSPGLHAPFVAAFNEGLKEAGFIEGQNLAIEYSWAEGKFDRLPALAADLIHDKVDVIAAMSGDLSIRAAIKASSTIPVVFITGSDPVQTGLVASLARPGGNATGFSMITTELMAKRFELLSELVPQIRTVALLINPKYHGATEGTIPLVQAAASAKGVRLHILNATDEDEFESAFASLARLKADALIVGTDPFFTSRRERIVALASRYSVPAIYEWQEFATAGGLISYGASLTSMYREAGVYVGKVLKGAKPADLPIQQPTKFELVINLKAAKALRLTVPPTLLTAADKVIE